MNFSVEGIWRAAVKHPKTGAVVTVPQPGRHHDCLWRARDFGWSNEDIVAAEQGFCTTTGRFVDRKEALVIAKARHQVKPRLPGQYNGDELFSEDVW